MRKIYSVLALILVFTLLLPQKTYSDQLKPIKLNAPNMYGGKPLMIALKQRKSDRSFSRKDLPLDVLSNLLWAASGINRPNGKLTSPTASNWQEIDIYVALKKGLYLYDRKKNTLRGVLAEDIRQYVGRQDFTQIAPVNLIFVANFSKMSDNLDNNIFYSATDTGFISQNVYLFCASEDLATVVLGYVDKPLLEKKMRLNKDQRVILTQPVGYRK